MSSENTIVSELQFNYSPELIDQYGSYKNYLAAQEKMIKTTSSWSLYNKGKAAYEDATRWYNSLNNVFLQHKNKRDEAKVKYDGLLAALKAEKGEKGEISMGERASLASKSGYTAELIKLTSDAEIAVDVALDARMNAVNTQRRGLYFNG